MFKIHFLGVRGSTPCAGTSHDEYGGHTTCVLVEFEEGIIIFDAGSGIINANPITSRHKNKTIMLYFTHVHLDHILGLPFFMPMWNPSYTVKLHAGNLAGYGGIEKVFSQTFNEPVFPISFKKFSGNIGCYDFKPGTTHYPLSGVAIETHALNHPNGAIGYRLTYQNKTMAFVTDNEHSIESPDYKLIDFIRYADVFIYDSSYNDDNFSKYVGWGHSTWQEAIRLGQAAQVKRIGIFHHDPLNDDKKMRVIEAQALQMDPHAFIAKQDMIINLL